MHRYGENPQVLAKLNLKGKMEITEYLQTKTFPMRTDDREAFQFPLKFSDQDKCKILLIAIPVVLYLTNGSKLDLG